MKAGIILCSRPQSERVPNKPFRKINGTPVIEHLMARLSETGLDTIVSVPIEDLKEYHYLEEKFDNTFVYGSKHTHDPLARMYEHALKHKLDVVVRVTHDKILVDQEQIRLAVNSFPNIGVDYLYGSGLIAGTGFEVISIGALKKAVAKFRNVEFISYAIRAVTDKTMDFLPAKETRGSQVRFLIDFPEDLLFFEVLFSQVGNNASLKDYLVYLDKHPKLLAINSQPLLTVYTCAYNADLWIDRCMDSIARQVGFPNYEYILIDDHSSDTTCARMAEFCLRHPNAYWIRNEKNLGLSSSSNVALKKARGKYILRLDADDYLVPNNALKSMVVEIDRTASEAIYPDNYFGHYEKIQKGKDQHHVGGAIFDKRAINHLKFTDGLRGYEGLDLFVRAKEQLRIGYYDRPIFMYTQRPDSMSRTNLEEREKVRQEILSKMT